MHKDIIVINSEFIYKRQRNKVLEMDEGENEKEIHYNLLHVFV